VALNDLQRQVNDEMWNTDERKTSGMDDDMVARIVIKWSGRSKSTQMEEER